MIGNIDINFESYRYVLDVSVAMEPYDGPPNHNRAPAIDRAPPTLHRPNSSPPSGGTAVWPNHSDPGTTL